MDVVNRAMTHELKQNNHFYKKGHRFNSHRKIALFFRRIQNSHMHINFYTKSQNEIFSFYNEETYQNIVGGRNSKTFSMETLGLASSYSFVNTTKCNEHPNGNKDHPGIFFHYPFHTTLWNFNQKSSFQCLLYYQFIPTNSVNYFAVEKALGNGHSRWVVAHVWRK